MVKISNRDWRRIKSTYKKAVRAYEEFKLTLEDQDAVEDAFYELGAILDKHSIHPEEKKEVK